MDKDKLQSVWRDLIGSSETHILEARIFHVTCIFTILLFTCSIFFNYFIGLYALSMMLIPAVFATLFVYYLSKFKYKHSLAVAIFCIAGNLLFAVFFLNNSGINGPSMLIYVLFFFLVMSIVPAGQRLRWLLINLMEAFALISYQYLHPRAITIKYRDPLAQHLDAGYVYCFTLLIVYFIITSIIDSYNKERLLSEQRSELLQQSNQSKTKLFSILAHDLKSPLNSIQNFLEISLEVDIEEHEKRTINTSLLRETKYTRQMLVNLLSWSKTQMDGMNVKLAKIDLQDVLEPTLQLQTSLAEEKGIMLHNHIPKNMLVVADNDMLELVIRNLVNNAIKFTPFGGEINVSAEVHAHECWIIVKDSGIGIAKSNYQHIFTLNSKSTYGTNNEKGVGLGLVLCKEFINLQQGKIWVNSTLGVGTTFFISLELASHADLFPVNLN